MRLSSVIISIICMFFFTSCYVNKEIVGPPKYEGNVYKDMVGMSKNTIIQYLSAPDRIMHDGNGGEILIYEKRSTITKVSASAISSSYTSSAAVAGYNQYGGISAVGASRTTSGYDYASQAISAEQKDYINFFINSSGKCYRVNTNVGDVYSPGDKTCARVANANLMWFLIPPFTLFVGIPVTIWYLCNMEKTAPCE